MTWCSANHVDALSCSAPEVLRYLQGLFDAGKSTSTLRGVVAAIKTTRVAGNRLAAEDCSFVAQFHKGAQRVAPHGRRLALPSRDLVLAALQEEPFEPMESAHLKWLSLKVAFLVAITSA